MPKGPKGEKRPADVVGAAVMVARIATGEVEDELTDDGKNEGRLRRLAGWAALHGPLNLALADPTRKLIQTETLPRPGRVCGRLPGLT